MKIEETGNYKIKDKWSHVLSRSLPSNQAKRWHGGDFPECDTDAMPSSQGSSGFGSSQDLSQENDIKCSQDAAPPLHTKHAANRLSWKRKERDGEAVPPGEAETPPVVEAEMDEPVAPLREIETPKPKKCMKIDEDDLVCASISAELECMSANGTVQSILDEVSMEVKCLTNAEWFLRSTPHRGLVGEYFDIWQAIQREMLLKDYPSNCVFFKCGLAVMKLANQIAFCLKADLIFDKPNGEIGV